MAVASFIFHLSSLSSRVTLRHAADLRGSANENRSSYVRSVSPCQPCLASEHEWMTSSHIERDHIYIYIYEATTACVCLLNHHCSTHPPSSSSPLQNKNCHYRRHHRCGLIKNLCYGSASSTLHEMSSVRICPLRLFETLASECGGDCGGKESCTRSTTTRSKLDGEF